jgi:hypothetical protein
VSVAQLNIAPSEFWGLTLREFWAIYNSKFGHVSAPVDREEYDNMKSWGSTIRGR